jgi:hypothetical protein
MIGSFSLWVVSGSDFKRWPTRLSGITGSPGGSFSDSWEIRPQRPPSGGFGRNRHKKSRRGDAHRECKSTSADLSTGPRVWAGLPFNQYSNSSQTADVVLSLGRVENKLRPDRRDFNGSAGCIEFKCRSGFADISRRASSFVSLETSRSMKRISLLVLWLGTGAFLTGCCHSYYSRCADFDDGCCDAGHSAKRCRGKRCRGEHRARGGDDCCCDSCCGDGGAMGTSPQTYDGGPAMQGSGCNNCGPGGCTGGNGGTSSMPMTYGGSMPMTYGGMPFNPGDGWTVQSTTSRPVGGEPIPAPGSTSTPLVPIPATSQGSWSAPSIAPVPAPVPPPVSFNR